MSSERKYYLFCLFKLHSLSKFKRQLVTSFDVISLESFEATEFNEIFSGRQPRQGVKVFRCFGT